MNWVILLHLLSTPVLGESIRLSAETFCPYTCSDSKNPGVSVETVQAIFSKLGYTTKFTPTPFIRGITLTREGKFDGLLSALNLPAFDDFVFPQEHLFYATGCLFTVADSKWNFSGVASLGSRRLGLVSGHAYGLLSSSFQGYIDDGKNAGRLTYLSGKDANTRLFMMTLKRLKN